MQHTRIFWIATLAVATAIALPKRALAEFQIQEAGIEKGETEFEYRGAYHWGVPEVTQNNENANDLVQSHEFELQHSFTNWFLLQLTVSLEQPLHEDLEASSVEFEPEFALIKRKGNGIALSFQGGYAKSTNGEPDTFGFGPIVELANKNLLITLNPLFTGQAGPNRGTDGLGFEYGWRAEYDFAKHWGIGVEMFFPMRARSTSRTTASARPCSGSPERRKRRVMRRRPRETRTMIRRPALQRCWLAIRCDGRDVRHGAKIPGIAFVLDAEKLQFPHQG